MNMEGEPALVIPASHPLAVSIAMEFARECEDHGLEFNDWFDLAYCIREWRYNQSLKVLKTDQFQHTEDRV